MEVPRLATFGAEADAGVRTPVAWPSLSREPGSAESRRGEDEAHPRVRGVIKGKAWYRPDRLLGFSQWDLLGTALPKPASARKKPVTAITTEILKRTGLHGLVTGGFFGVGAARPVAPSPGFGNVE